MRALFTLIVFLLLVAAVWLAVSQTDRVYCRMILNKATHEFSLYKRNRAIERAVALLERNPRYRPALEAAIGWLLAQKEFERARQLALEYPDTGALSPRARYQLAICAYETGYEQETASLFKSLGEIGETDREVPAALVGAFLALAQEDHETARTALEAANSRFADDLFYHSILGRSCYARGDIAMAARELERAAELGERNPRAHYVLSICKAMLGDLRGMQRLLDPPEAEGLNAYSLAQREIENWLGRLSAVNRYVTPLQEATDRERMLNLRLAMVAIDVRQGRIDEAHETLAALAKSFPGRLGVATWRGLLFEREKQLDQALALYRSEADRLLLAAYKAATLDPLATATSESAVWREFLTSGSLVFDGQTMNHTGGQATGRGWVLFSTGDFSTSFTVRSTGRYALDLIARGDPANGVWPVVIVYIDGQKVAEQYINSPVWDLFELEQPLLGGRHAIRLFYTNDAAGPGVEGDRNFYLDKLIIRSAPN